MYCEQTSSIGSLEQKRLNEMWPVSTMLSSKDVTSSSQQPLPNDTTLSPLHQVTRSLISSPENAATTSDISIFDLAVYSIQMVISEWTLYSSLMGQYLKLYEFSFETLTSLTNAEVSDIMLDLHRWRRRGQRSLEKLSTLKSFIKQNSTVPTLGKPLLEDVDFLATQIGEYRQSLESMVPMLTSMIQLMESRRAMEETVYVKRLTHIALFFLPLSFVASLFSMNEGFAINTSGFKVYLATALPLLVVVLIFSNLPFTKLWHWRRIGRLSMESWRVSIVRESNAHVIA